MSIYPTRMELRNAVAEAEDFITTNMNGADDECQAKYANTLDVLARFRKFGRLSRPQRLKRTLSKGDK